MKLDNLRQDKIPMNQFKSNKKSQQYINERTSTVPQGGNQNNNHKIVK